ncbi:hypothetical protein HPB50_016118 [Hyalomma asiaticum]|uniref:Uncharacterized protein n=1 Tax=Hyalomma asiaticum TaxID=266040 RepID=A0ACB7SYT4_HYAAI|nr:hypothetical protein HPB50_016118 [Hyalomma asiaticum]
MDAIVLMLARLRGDPKARCVACPPQSFQLNLRREGGDTIRVTRRERGPPTRTVFRCQRGARCRGTLGRNTGAAALYGEELEMTHAEAGWRSGR